MTNYTAIAIERIATGSVIYVRDTFNAAAEVLDIEFDADRYIITYGTDDCQNTTSIKAGETVEAFNGQTFLRADADISFEEWQATNAAAGARLDASLAALSSQIDQRPLYEAVAAGVGVPALSEVA